MTTRTELLAACRARIGIRWRHQARADGVAYDCGGLVLCAALAAGVPNAWAAMHDQDCQGYGRDPDGRTLQLLCERYLDPIAIRDAREADVYLMRFPSKIGDRSALPTHLAVVSSVDPPKVIHAYRYGARKVCESRIDGDWQQGIPWNALIVSAWQFRGVE